MEPFIVKKVEKNEETAIVLDYDIANDKYHVIVNGRLVLTSGCGFRGVYEFSKWVK